MKTFSLLLFLSLIVTACCKSPEKAKDGKSRVVYSFSNVTATEDGTNVSQMTIATAPDGKYHYVRKENGKTFEGIWKGPLPSTPNVDNMLEEITKEAISPQLTSLSSGIDNFVQDYLKKAFDF